MEIFKFEWDEKKNQTNVFKHGIDFKQACVVFYDEHKTIILDNRKDYGENREIIIGKDPESPILLTIVYTERKNVYRIISARFSNTKEQNIYHAHY